MNPIHLAKLKMELIAEEFESQIETAEDDEGLIDEYQKLITRARLADTFPDLVQVMVDAEWDFGGAVSFMIFALCPEAQMDMADVDAFQKADWST